MVADGLTNSVADYLETKGIKLTVLSRNTRISEGILRRCLASKNRDLRAEEFMEICNFLEKDPFDFFVSAGMVNSAHSEKPAAGKG